MKKTILAAVLSAAALMPAVSAGQEDNLPEFTQEEKGWIRLQYQFRDCVSDNVGYGENRSDVFANKEAMQAIRDFCFSNIAPVETFNEIAKTLEQRYPDEEQFMHMLGKLQEHEEDGYFDYATPMMPQ